MAVYDHRAFRVDGEWWIAEVHMASTEATWGSDPGPSVREQVFFSSIDPESSELRFAEIPAGKLNRLSHRAIRGLWSGAERSEGDLEMYPYNTPDAEELKDYPAVKDDEDLNWVVRPTQVVRIHEGKPEIHSGVEAICLDDSALRKEITLSPEDTFDDLMRVWGQEGLRALVEGVKSLYEELPDDGT